MRSHLLDCGVRPARWSLAIAAPTGVVVEAMGAIDAIDTFDEIDEIDERVRG